MEEGHDFLATAEVGAVLRTRDRRDATITGVDPSARLIHGTVTMFGTCSWRANGVYADAPAGAAGPLDLIAPASGPAANQRHVSVTDELDGTSRAFCCD